MLGPPPPAHPGSEASLVPCDAEPSVLLLSASVLCFHWSSKANVSSDGSVMFCDFFFRATLVHNGAR